MDTNGYYVFLCFTCAEVCSTVALVLAVKFSSKVLRVAQSVFCWVARVLFLEFSLRYLIKL